MEIEPDASDTYYSKGAAHLAIGSLRRAISSLDQAIAINDKKSDYFAFRAMAHASQGNEELSEADFKSAVSLGWNAVLLREQVNAMNARSRNSQ